jgi:hypothetical protein
MHRIFGILSDNLVSREIAEEMKRLDQIENELEQLKLLEGKINEAIKQQDFNNLDKVEPNGSTKGSNYVAYLTHVQHVLDGMKRAVETMDESCEDSIKKVMDSVTNIINLDLDSLEEVDTIDESMSLDSRLDLIEMSLENICFMLYELAQLTSPMEGSQSESEMIECGNSQVGFLNHKCPDYDITSCSSPGSEIPLRSLREKLETLTQLNGKFLDDRKNCVVKNSKKIKALFQKLILEGL